MISSLISSIFGGTKSIKWIVLLVLVSIHLINRRSMNKDLDDCGEQVRYLGDIARSLDSQIVLLKLDTADYLSINRVLIKDTTMYRQTLKGIKSDIGKIRRGEPLKARDGSEFFLPDVNEIKKWRKGS